jgi:hypothetical protein
MIDKASQWIMDGRGHLQGIRQCQVMDRVQFVSIWRWANRVHIRMHAKSRSKVDQGTNRLLANE